MEGGKEYLGLNILKREKSSNNLYFRVIFIGKESRSLDLHLVLDPSYAALVYQVKKHQSYFFSIQYGLRIPD